LVIHVRPVFKRILLAQLLKRSLAFPTLLLVIYGLAQQRREFLQNQHPHSSCVRFEFSFAILLVFLALRASFRRRYTMLFSLSLFGNFGQLVIDNMLVQIETLKRRNGLRSARFSFSFILLLLTPHISFGDSRGFFARSK